MIDTNLLKAYRVLSDAPLHTQNHALLLVDISKESVVHVMPHNLALGKHLPEQMMREGFMFFKRVLHRKDLLSA
ncbi:MAG: hypothetical protein LBM62_06880 [Mediterranea sp.]|jgi:hypothetical protein|nr:hypothetical protein [Mediterranea sp.]